MIFITQSEECYYIRNFIIEPKSVMKSILGRGLKCAEKFMQILSPKIRATLVERRMYILRNDTYA